jgi:CHAD domain-containing protein
MEFAAEYCGMSIRSQHALVKEFVERAGKIHDVDVMIQKLIKFSKKISGTHLPDSARSLKSFLSYLNEMRKSEYNKLIDVIKKIEPARFREKFITEMQK